MKGLSLLLLLAIGAYSQSCVGRCGDDDISIPCQCDVNCYINSNCCTDYYKVCFSCQDRCREAYSPSKPCQCNDQCASQDNCCQDYDYRCANCVWEKPRDFPAIPPLLFDSSYQMILPTRATKDDPRIVRVENGTHLTIACSGNYIASFGQAVDAIQGTCIGDNLISIDRTVYSLKTLGCYKNVSSNFTEIVNDDCVHGTISAYVSIGFYNSIWGTYEMIGLCFDHQAETTLFTKHFLLGANIEAKEITPHPPFQELTTYFNVTMAEVYTPDSELQLMIQILKSVDIAKKIIVPGQELYIAKGHLAPDADFVLAAEQNATYYYINAVPQWQLFKNGNWKCLESVTRNLAQRHQSKLTIYTGTYGVLELDDKNRDPQQIYLGLFESERVVPVPALIWKVVYEESSNQACLVIGINNSNHIVPELGAIIEHLQALCYRDCSRFQWLDPCELENPRLGHCFCCPVNPLRTFIPSIPNLGDVQDLLD